MVFVLPCVNLCGGNIWIKVLFPLTLVRHHFAYNEKNQPRNRRFHQGEKKFSAVLRLTQH